MADLDLDAIIDQTLETLASGAIEEGLIHSGQAGGSFVDLDPDAMLARLRDVHYYVGLVLRGSPLAAEVERLRAAVAYDRDRLVEVLVYHQRTDTSGCHCGWAVLGASYAEHVADVYEMSASGGMCG